MLQLGLAAFHFMDKFQRFMMTEAFIPKFNVLNLWYDIIELSSRQAAAPTSACLSA